MISLSSNSPIAPKTARARFLLWSLVFVALCCNGFSSNARAANLAPLASWGENTGDGTSVARTNPVAVAGLRISAVSAGDSFSVGLKSDGSVLAWGSNNYGQLGDGSTTNRTTPTPVSGLGSGVAAISAGKYHALALKSDGSVVAWGYNGEGELGNGTTINSPSPVAVSGLGSGVISISAGGTHSLALKSDGSVVAWGDNYYGQIGDGTNYRRFVPVAVSGLSGVKAISAAGFAFSLALKSNGSVVSWGWNNYGQLGDGTTTDHATPVAVNGLSSGMSAISAGTFHALALRSNGTVVGWGYNGDGQLGDGTSTNRSLPVTAIGLSGATAMSAGVGHSLALKSDGSVAVWGSNGYGQLGDGSTDNRATPVVITGLKSADAISAGRAHSIALKSDGSVAAWGDNSGGGLGDGTTTRRLIPIPVSGLSGLLAFSAGGVHCLALRGDGSVVAWGYNGVGALGNGSTDNSAAPVAVSGLSSVIAVSGGGYHSLALKSDGSVVAWGRNNYGQIGDGTTTTRTTPVFVSGLSGVVAISAGDGHSLALKTDGSVVAWGSNDYGELGDGATTARTSPVTISGLTGVSAISAGGIHSLALQSNGSVWAWGYNGAGALGDGTNTSRATPSAISSLSSITAISAGNHSLALQSNGKVWAWGFNSSGQLGDGSTTDRATPQMISGLSSIAAISAGNYHSLALASNGIVTAWGSNNGGRLGDGTSTTRTTPVPARNSDGSIFRALAIEAGGNSLAVPGVAAQAGNLAFATVQNTAKSFVLPASNPENRPFTWQVPATTTQGGTLAGSAPNLVYTPRSGFSGIDTFTYKISDGALTSTGTATISVFEASSIVTTVNESNSKLDGVTSMREAILYANAHAGPDVVSFAIPGTTVKIIKPTSTLPAITTENNAATNVGTFINAIGKSIVLDGSLAAGPGLVVLSNDCKIQGLTIQNFTGSGILVSGTASRVAIGGVTLGEGNSINNNRVDGVRIENSATRILVRGNAIFSNSGLGINLVQSGEDGSVATSNDIDTRAASTAFFNLTDSDLGPNGLQNFPIITGMTRNQSTGDVVVSGMLRSNRNTSSYVLDFYGSTDADNSGYGEGERYLRGFANIPIDTDTSGQYLFSRTIPAAVVGNSNFITMTATSAVGATSEFSQTQSLRLPSVAYFTGVQGSVGTSIGIYGSNFPGATQVRFGPTNIPATFAIRRPDFIEARVPFGAQTGKISVQNAVGTFTTTTNFTVLNNDPFNSTIKLVGDRGSLQSTNVGFSAQSGERAHAGAAAQNSAWFEWRPSKSVTVSLDTRFSRFDTRLAVYTAQNPSNPTITALNPVPGAQNDDEVQNSTSSRVVFNANGNTTYYIAVDGKGQTPTGLFNLNWSSGSTASPTIFWNNKNPDNGGESGSWEIPGNWNLNRVPNTSDIVAIDLPGTYTVQMDAPVSVQGIKLGPAASPLGTQTLDLNGKTLTLTSAKSVVNGSGAGNRGRIVLRPGSVLVNHVTATSNIAGLAISGWLDWQGGTITGRGQTGIQSGGLLQLGGTAPKMLDRHIFTNRGITTWSDSGNWQFTNKAAFYNFSFVDLKSDADFTSDTSATLFSNQINGLFRKSAGSGITTCAIKFNNLAGTVESSSGVLSLQRGGTNSRAFKAGPNGVLECNGDYFFDTQSATFGPTNAGAGTLRLLGQQLEIKYGAKFSFSGGRVEFPAGSRLKVYGVYTQSSGVTNLSGGRIELDDSDGPMTINGGSLVGSGNIEGRVICKGILAPLRNNPTTNRVAPRAGDVGNLNIADLTLLPQSNLIFNIGLGFDNLPLFARLVVDSDVTFGGKITIQPLLGSGFVFAQGQNFDVLRARKFIGGDFADGNKILPIPPANAKWLSNTYPDLGASNLSNYFLSLAPLQGGSSLAITSPANGAQLATLPEIQGSTTAALGNISRVDLFLRRPVMVGDVATYEYWAQRAGVSSWNVTKNALLTTLTTPGAPTTAWKCAQANLPSGANLGVGALELFANAFDASANPILSTISTVTIQSNDAVAPTISITAPVANSKVATLTAISGTMADNIGVTRVDLYFQRLSDKQFWNGTAWTIATPISTVLSAGKWSRTTGLPTGAKLPPGAYFIAARAFDAANNGTSATMNFSVSAADTTAPTISIAAPINAAFVNSFTTISGVTADNIGVTRVDLYLQRLSDNKYWNGTTWAGLTSISTVLSAGTWSKTAGLPTGANLLPGAYFAAARAYDAAGNGTSATVDFTLDTAIPTIAIASPAPGSTVPALASAPGTSADTGGAGIARVAFYLQRKSDGKWWNGADWGASVFELATTLAPAGNQTAWSISNLPRDGNLLDGSYTIGVETFDRAGNSGNTNGTFTLKRAPALATNSPLQLSAATARSNGTIRLVFSGALDGNTGDAANFVVSRDGQKIPITRVSQPNASEIEIVVGALAAGTRVAVSYNLRDAQGRALEGVAHLVAK